MTDHGIDRTGAATGQIATITAGVLAIALSVGSRSIVVAGCSLTAGLLLIGLWILRIDSVRRLTAGSALVALSGLYAGGLIAAVAGSSKSWVWIAAASTWTAVVCSGWAGRLRVDWTRQWRSIAALGVGGVGLLLSGTALSVTASTVTAAIEGISYVFALSGQPVSLSAFLVLVALVFGVFAVTLKSLPTVTLLGLDATSEDVEAVENATLLAVILVVVSIVGSLFFTSLSTETTQIAAIQVVTTNTPLRLLFVTVFLGGSVASISGLVLRWAWYIDEDTLRDRGVVILAGVAVTIGGLVGAIVGVPGSGQPIGIAAASDRAVALGGLGLILVLLAILVRFAWVNLFSSRDRSDGIVLGGFTGAVAVSAGTDAIFTPLLAVGATLVAWDVATHGRSLFDALGNDAPTADVEFIHASGSILVAVTGVFVATVATYGLQWVGPTIVSIVSIPGLAVGALLIVVGAVVATMETDGRSQ